MKPPKGGAIKRQQHLIVSEGARRLGLQLSASAAQQLVEYALMLAQANTRFNLLSRRTMAPRTLLERHVLDSLRASEHLCAPSVADVGSGPGLPGIPLAIARPELKMSLFERSSRRCDFLKLVKARLGLDQVEVEEVDVGTRPFCQTFNTVVARALAPCEKALALLTPLVKESGRIVLFVGKESMDVPLGVGQRSVILLTPAHASEGRG